MAMLTRGGQYLIENPYSITTNYSYDNYGGTATIEVPLNSIQAWGTNGTSITTSGGISFGSSYQVPPVKREESAVEWLKRQVNEVCDEAFREVRR